MSDARADALLVVSHGIQHLRELPLRRRGLAHLVLQQRRELLREGSLLRVPQGRPAGVGLAHELFRAAARHIVLHH